MQVGRFFSLGQGRVGQYLSPRVLIVRAPFQRVSRGRTPKEYCCFRFRRLKQAQRFSQFLASMGFSFQLHHPQQSPDQLPDYPYEVRLVGHTDLASDLAYWDRRDRNSMDLPNTLAPQH
ncbi:MAG: hypothetical protein QNJ46_21530 [Leptolyngbyaceae cyanobacterium MO_188.B28]|nr:hypothetical protein [Leptolyngbyaceae cyanobacterium MO_188.B28]